MISIITILLISLLIVVVIIFFNKYLEEKKQKQLQEISQRIGLTYVYETDYNFLDTVFTKFKARKKYGSEGMKIWFKGTQRGKKWTIFQYQVETGSGKNRHVENYTCFLIEANKGNIPQFLMSSENFLHKIGQIFGYQDIDFDSHPEFSKKYLLRGENEQEIKKLIEPLTNYFESKPMPYTIEGRENQILIYSQNKIKLKDFDKHFNTAKEISDKFLKD